MLAIILWVGVALTGAASAPSGAPTPSVDTVSRTEAPGIKPRWLERGRALLIGVGIGLGVILGIVLVGWLIGGPDGALLALILIGVLLLFVGLLALAVLSALRPRRLRGPRRPGVVVVPPPPPPPRSAVPPPGHRPPPGRPVRPGPAPRTPGGQTTPPPPRGGARPRP